MRKPLTNNTIKSAEPGDVLFDESVSGLHMRVFAGSKGFYFYYRTKAGRERRPKLGVHPTITLAAARDTARQWAGVVAAGGDPQGDFEGARGSLTVGAMIETYLTDKAGKTAAEKRRLMEKDVLPRFANRKAESMTPDEWIALHRAITKRGAYVANRTLQYVSAAYNLAIARKRLADNPCTAVDLNQERKRKRFAKAPELAAIGPLLEQWAPRRPRAVAFLYLLMFSGARPQEIQDATWAMLEIAGDCGILRLPDGKTGTARDVYLPNQAMLVINSLPRTSGTITGISKVTARLVWNEIRTAAGCPDLWMRDSRRTFATSALSGGTSLAQLGELLGHKSQQTTMIYGKLMENAAHTAAGATATALAGLLDRDRKR